MNKKKLSLNHEKDREKFCKDLLNRQHDLPFIVYSDEKLFKRCPNNNKVIVRRKKGTAYLDKNMNFIRGSGGYADCNVFMFITRDGKGGLFLAEKSDLYDQNGNKLRTLKVGEKKGFDGDSYFELLRDYVIPSIKDQLGDYFIYMQDNASIHNSKNLKKKENEGESVSKLLNELNIELLDWPPLSPDMNPVENVWSLLSAAVKERLNKLKTLPKNKKQMWGVIKKCWTQLDNQKVINIYNSVENRLKEVKSKKGKITRY